MQVYMPWNTSGKAGQETASQLASSHRPVSRHASLKYFLKVAHGGRVIHQMLISRSETGESLKRQNPNLGTCVCVCVCGKATVGDNPDYPDGSSNDLNGPRAGLIRHLELFIFKCLRVCLSLERAESPWPIARQ